MKKCTNCEVIMELSEFHKDKSEEDGHKNKCKSCILEYNKEYRNKNKEKLSDNGKNYYDKNKEEINKKHRDYYHSNKDKISDNKKQYYEDNKEEINKRNLEYKENNKEIIKISGDKWRKNNKHIIAWRNTLNSTLVRMGLVKDGHTIDLLGYSSEDLKYHMESLFEEGMSWENHGEWHIDHKIPLCSFDKETPIYVVNSLENLQPLWADDNLSKHGKIFDEYKTMDIYVKYCT